MHKLSLYLLSAGLLSCSFSSYSQTEENPETDISIEDLLHLKAETEASDLQKMLNENVAASSRKKLASRETPGIVSVISDEEIINSGARDLMDVLRLVPGFDFAADVDFVIGVGLRGNWANEGKVLVMVDGHEYNELLYQTVPFGNKFPVDEIRRIEIIRGPGSSMYGGTAEYGVINIITRGGSGVEGIHAAGSYGFLPDNFGRRNGSLSVGKKLGEDWYVDGSFYQGESVKSDQMYQDLYLESDPVDLTEQSLTQTTNANIGVAYKGTRIRGIMDQYKLYGPDFMVSYDNFYLSAKNDIKINKKVSLTPYISYTSQIPWAYRIRETDEDDYRVRAQRTKANLSGSWDITRKINVIAGAEAYHDRAASLLDDDNFGEEVPFVEYNNFAFFGQGLFRHRLTNITLGVRYDKHNAYGASFVPRLALTRRFGNFHFKTLYSHSYRAPGIENINLNEAIRPEKSNTAELELGYQFTPDMLLAFNAFQINTRDAIIYSYEDLDNGDYLEAYNNFERTGSRGIEVVYKIKQGPWYVNASYSLYKANVDQTVDTYKVADHERLFVAFPAHKLSVQSSVQLGKNLRFNPSLIHVSERYGYSEIDNEDMPVLNRFEPYTMLNLFLNYEHLVAEGLDLGVGVYDVFNTKEPMLQAYNGDYAPVSGRSREITLKLSYEFSFNKSKK